MAKKSKRSNDGPHLFWRNGRAYADLRTYADIGGGREALAEPGKKWGTTELDIALVLFEARLSELKAKRQGRVGVPQEKTTKLSELVRHHLLMKAKAGRTSDSHMFDLESRLRAAIDYFGSGPGPPDDHTGRCSGQWYQAEGDPSAMTPVWRGCLPGLLPDRTETSGIQPEPQGHGGPEKVLYYGLSRT